MKEFLPSPDPTRPTLRDVALAAGVSKSVAQRVLAGRPGVSASTRQRVQQAAARLGYRPDPALATIAAARWKSDRVRSGSSIAWLVDVVPTSNVRLSACTALTEAIHLEADALGYGVQPFVANEVPPARLARILRARGIQIVLVGDVSDPDEIRGFPWHEFACVAVGLGVYRPPVPLVMRSIGDCVHEAWRRLDAGGYRRIGCVLYHGDHVAHNRPTHAAVLLEQELRPRTARLPVLFLQDNPRPALTEYLAHHAPDALLVPNPILCAELEEWGLARNASCGLVSMKLYRNEGRWAGFDYNARGIVRHALRIARHQSACWQGTGGEPTTTYVPNSWWNGASLPLPRRKTSGHLTSPRRR